MAADHHQQAADTNQLASAYAHCQRMVRDHYENFPVASFILPKRLRQPISVSAIKTIEINAALRHCA